MKTVLVVCALIAVALAQEYVDYHGDGQPACNDQELAQRYWRNTWDPTALWRCDNLNEAAVRMTCFELTTYWGYLFSEAAGTCIPADDWVWTFPQPPPSQVVAA